MHLDYYNTATTVLLAELFKAMDRLSKIKKVSVEWVYEEDDFDMEETGLDYITVFGDFIKLVPISSED